MSILKKIKFKFSNPKKNKIILFDGESSHDLKYVLEGFDYYMLENRSNRIYEIYLSINVIFRFILNYFLLFYYLMSD